MLSCYYSLMIAAYTVHARIPWVPLLCRLFPLSLFLFQILELWLG